MPKNKDTMMVNTYIPIKPKSDNGFRKNVYIFPTIPPLKCLYSRCDVLLTLMKPCLCRNMYKLVKLSSPGTFTFTGSWTNWSKWTIPAPTYPAICWKKEPVRDFPIALLPTEMEDTKNSTNVNKRILTPFFRMFLTFFSFHPFFFIYKTQNMKKADMKTFIKSILLPHKNP